MSEVNARILLWGLDGAGKRTTLATIHEKLRDDLRGDLRQEPTRLDPTVTYTCLPISLGNLGGVGTQIELVAVPGGADQKMTRKQLLDEVDGIVLVLDCSPERIGANFEAIDELRESLAAYGRTLETFPVVLQYNKRDVGDPFAIEDLHRRIGLAQAAVFETIATSGHGIMHTLTTISKHVVRARRGTSGELDAQTAAAAAAGSKLPAAPIAPPEPAAVVDTLEVEALDEAEAMPDIELDLEPLAEAAHTTDADDAFDTADLLESAILTEGDDAGFQTLGAIEVDLDDSESERWATPLAETEEKTPDAARSLRIVSVGQARVQPDGGVRLPLVLGDEDGGSQSVVLSLRLDALVGSESDD